MRQGVAFARSQILVISGFDIKLVDAVASDRQPIPDLAFGNYEDILKRVTLPAVMAEYPDMVNKTSPSSPSIGTRITRASRRGFFSIGVRKL